MKNGNEALGLLMSRLLGILNRPLVEILLRNTIKLSVTALERIAKGTLSPIPTKEAALVWKRKGKNLKYLYD